MTSQPVKLVSKASSEGDQPVLLGNITVDRLVNFTIVKVTLQRSWNLMNRGSAEIIGRQMFLSVSDIEPEDEEVMRWAEFIRMRVEIAVLDPLKVGFEVIKEDDNTGWVTLQYERLPYLCYMCGKLGRVLTHCSLEGVNVATKIADRSHRTWGPWMKAEVGQWRKKTCGSYVLKYRTLGGDKTPTSDMFP
ncbi:hypothetical protein Tsubulata_022580 [Turnera subulata]|uniref:Zinc knuckle CX2CX4HX4C domain-containing protein n=1 Tax=Turnera subulata TaxID=218843 RepID=A0A9Q0FZM4_9ROSI|nr:hypothetical protein Tsubulata_022580 [Turnera subulata]